METIRPYLEKLPAALVALRFGLALLLLIDSLDRQTGLGFVVAYGVAIASDIFDGIIARRLDVSTPALRQADSWADRALLGAVAVSTWRVFPQVILAFKTPLLGVLGAQMLLFTLSLIKFKKLPSFHTYTAKIWGLTLLVAILGLFGFGQDQLLWPAIFMGTVNSLEESLMTLILPIWQCDILSVFHALRLRQPLDDNLTNAGTND